MTKNLSTQVKPYYGIGKSKEMNSYFEFMQFGLDVLSIPLDEFDVFLPQSSCQSIYPHTQLHQMLLQRHRILPISLNIVLQNV